MIVIEDGQARETSRAAEPDIGALGDLYHRECYEQLGEADEAGEGDERVA